MRARRRPYPRRRPLRIYIRIIDNVKYMRALAFVYVIPPVQTERRASFVRERWGRPSSWLLRAIALVSCDQ